MADCSINAYRNMLQHKQTVCRVSAHATKSRDWHTKVIRNQTSCDFREKANGPAYQDFKNISNAKHRGCNPVDTCLLATSHDSVLQAFFLFFNPLHIEHQQWYRINRQQISRVHSTSVIRIPPRRHADPSPRALKFVIFFFAPGSMKS